MPQDAGRAGHAVASMEPDLIGQEKGARLRLPVEQRQASMEPDLIGQEKSGVSWCYTTEGEASMEPDLIGQEKARIHCGQV